MAQKMVATQNIMVNRGGVSVALQAGDEVPEGANVEGYGDLVATTEDFSDAGEAPPGDLGDVISKNVTEVVAWVLDGDDQAERVARAELAKAAEEEKDTPRSSLVSQLEEIIG